MMIHSIADHWAMNAAHAPLHTSSFIIYYTIFCCKLAHISQLHLAQCTWSKRVPM